ncbi:MAG: hypothetical protein H7Y15_14890 [Pseudonocardia sp.]|nr:hypothetical protein [Pseudonocardia sp.]
MAESINRRCGWCGVRLRLLRMLMLRRYCDTCGPRLNGSMGIYLQAGGPPCPPMSRAEDHHVPGALLDERDRPASAPWWRQMLCEHCFHLAPGSGSWCCDCGRSAAGLPVGACLPCDVSGTLR